MPVRKMRAALTAIFLGTAVAGTAVLAMGLPAQALTVSAKVGPLLNEAKALFSAGKYDAALAKLKEADAVKSTPDDTAVINSIKQAIGVKTGDVALGGAAAAKAKFANDYNAGKFKDVIADADILRNNGALDSQSQLIVGQAYYKGQDYAGCVKYAKNLGGSDTALELEARCAYEIGDEATQHSALETLVSRSNKPEYWALLLKITERTKGLNDHNTLDINRIRYMTGNVVTKDDYVLLAQLALQLGNAAEAQTYINKGIEAKVLNDDRTQRLMALAKQQSAANAANEAKTLAAANAAPQGDDLVKLGENMIGEGKAKDAVGVIQNGMKKPLKDANNAQIRLGQAYLAAGQKGDAESAFNKVKAPEKDAMVSHLWALASHH